MQPLDIGGTVKMIEPHRARNGSRAGRVTGIVQHVALEGRHRLSMHHPGIRIVGIRGRMVHESEKSVPDAGAESFYKQFGFVGFDPGIDGGCSFDGGRLAPVERFTGIIHYGRDHSNPIFAWRQIFNQSLTELQIMGIQGLLQGRIGDDGIQGVLIHGCEVAIAEFQDHRCPIDEDRIA